MPNMQVNTVLRESKRWTFTANPVSYTHLDVYKRQPQTGEWEDYPNFVDCTMFGTRAEAVSRYLSKGSKVAIEGKLRYSSWERDGQRRSKLEVIVDEIEFMSRGQQGEAGGYAPAPSYGQQGGYAPAPAPQQAPAPMAAPVPPAVDVYDEDIPF